MNSKTLKETMESNIKRHGIDSDCLNREVSPKTDFYEFAGGGWIKQNPMPDDFATYGQFDV